MALSAGENLVKDAYWGADRVKRMYLGDTMAYRAIKASQKIPFEQDSAQSQVSGTTDVIVDCNFYKQITLRLTIEPLETYDAPGEMDVRIRIKQADESMYEKSTGRILVPNDKNPFSVSVTAMVDDIQLGEDKVCEVQYWFGFYLSNYDGYENGDPRLARRMSLEVIEEA